MAVTRRQLLQAALPLGCAAQSTTEENYRVYSDPPRLLLRPQRLRLLRRERERQSARWTQFETLIKGKAQMPEPGLAWALYHQVAGDQPSGRSAIAWAMTSNDLRQVALVSDWCGELLSPAEKRTLSAKLASALTAPGGKLDITSARNRAFAALANADHTPNESAQALKQLVDVWWKRQTAPALKTGGMFFERREIYPLFEFLHGIRDSFEVDLRADAGYYFRDLPSEQLLSYYPATFPAAENEYRIPAYLAAGDPDLRLAALSRAAEMALVAFDNTATESQFVQGWLLHDRYTMMGAFGAPYEFLWANPYQPGLAFHHLPLRFHDPKTGRLLVRSSWEEDATWLGYLGREIQMYADGARKAIKVQKEPLILGETAVLPGTLEFKVDREGPAHFFITNLKAKTKYTVEADDEEIVETSSDVGGIVALQFPRREAQGVRLREFAPQKQ